MQGKIKKLKNGSEYAFPVTIADAVYVDKDTSLTAKLSMITGGAQSTYHIELDRWGIKLDATTQEEAVANSYGINKALEWAKANKFRTAYLGRGYYLIDPFANRALSTDSNRNTGIVMQDGLNFEMHDDTILQVIPNNQQGYRAITMYYVNNLSITGGQIRGDRYDHDYGAKMLFEQGDLDSSGNPTINSTTIVRSKDFVQYYSDGIQIPTKIQLFRLDGIVIDQGAEFKCNVYCYDANNVLLQVFNEKMWLDVIQCPSNTRKWKITMIQNQCFSNTSAYICQQNILYPSHENSSGIFLLGCNNILMKNLNVSKFTGDAIVPAITPDSVVNTNIFIEDCILEDCRRQGLSVVGGAYIYVRRCLIQNINGNPPMFGIDIETGGAVGTCHDIFVDDTIFIDNAKGDIVNYDGRGLYVRRCTFTSAIGSTAGYDIAVYDSTFKDTTHNRTALQLTASAYDRDPESFTIIQGCTFDGFKTVGVLSDSRKLYFENNKIFNCSTALSTLTFGKCDLLISRNNFYKDIGPLSYRYSSAQFPIAGVIANETFINIKSVALNDTCVITNLTFERSPMSGIGNVVLNSSSIDIGNMSNFINPFIDNSNTSSITLVGGSIIGEVTDRNTAMSTQNYKLKFKGVNIKTNAMTLKAGAGALELIDCDIEMTDVVGNTANITLMNSSTGSSLHMRNCNWRYIGDAMPVFNWGGNSFTFLFNNTFESITTPQFNFPSVFLDSGTTYISGTTVNQNPSNKRTTEPNSGTYGLGHIIYHSSPVAGGYLGWVCTTRGIANNDPWVANNAAWVGRIIKSNGKVYKCTIAGTTGSVAPSHTSGTATDGTVVWTYQDTLAVFKTFGVISA